MKDLCKLVLAAMNLEPGLWIDYRIEESGNLVWSCTPRDASFVGGPAEFYATAEDAVYAFLSKKLSESQEQLRQLQSKILDAETLVKEGE